MLTNIINFIWDIIIPLPLVITEDSECKVIRILGFFVFMIWFTPIFILCLPFFILLLQIDFG